jgi:hypothetical protein
MQKLALTFVLATAAAALATVSTKPGITLDSDHAKTLAIACCDDPPPPCWPNGPCGDKTPDGSNVKAPRR